jgi:hypothetical protein
MAVDIVECPHCYTRVLPNAAGTCPSCARDVNDTTGIDPTRTSVGIETNTLLPPVCSACGEATGRTVEIVSKQGGGKAQAEEEYASLRMSVFAFFLRALRPSRADRPEICIQLPQCQRCAAAQGRPTPRAVSFDRATMIFEVHREFRRAVEAMTE